MDILGFPLIFLEVRTIDYLINEQIRDKEVRVIGAEGNQLGVMTAKEAQHLADEAGLDLVRVSPNAQPPVCRIIDYSKFRYEQTRKDKVERESGYRHEPFVTLRRRGGSERRNLSESGPESGAETADSCHCDAGNGFMKKRLGVGNS